jgi:hypothetical protein
MRLNWWINRILLGGLGLTLWNWFKEGWLKEWTSATVGICLADIAAFLFRRRFWFLVFLWAGLAMKALFLHAGSRHWFGGNFSGQILFSSIVAAFMYFVARLQRVPIFAGLDRIGYGKGACLKRFSWLTCSEPAEYVWLFGELSGLKKQLCMSVGLRGQWRPRCAGWIFGSYSEVKR